MSWTMTSSTWTSARLRDGVADGPGRHGGGVGVGRIERVMCRILAVRWCRFGA
ncbi:hypothetical protein [Streptomyces sp. NPDC058412]|uniref:hypothetical protein n=1 Tax=Streptomyces sp. NPDC058412 TaxID=3346486 RepID=UPI0036584D8A